MRKFLPYILILVVLVGTGFFGPTEKASAYQVGQACTITVDGEKVNGAYVAGVSGREGTSLKCEPGATVTVEDTPADFEEEVGGSCLALIKGDFDACAVKITYWLFYSIPSFLLTSVAKFFNVAIHLGLQASVYSSSDFLPQAWRITRDLSNIFFILILLYIAIKIILGLAGHDGKKMIIWVIIMALLINFSMFATKIVIDSSNVLALIFYNKMEVKAKDPTNKEGPSYNATHEGERDISGGLVGNFDVTKLMTQDFFDKVKERTHMGGVSLKGFTIYTGGGFLIGGPVGAGIGAGAYVAQRLFSGFRKEIPAAMKMAIILAVGLILWYAIYAFFMAGLAFVVRLVELWILIIFSPFAFMSFAMPALKKVKYIGWAEWSHRPLSVSFMATIFMFFMYFIFMIAQTDLFNSKVISAHPSAHPIEILVFTMLPALILLILLQKASSYAKKGSGELGTWAMKGVKLAGGMAVGVGLGAAAFAGRQTVGRVATNLGENQKFKKWAEKSRIGTGALQATRWVGGKSFDARGAPGVDKALGMTGLAGGAAMVGKVKEGGFAKQRKEFSEEQEKIANSLELSEKERIERGLVFRAKTPANQAYNDMIQQQIDKINLGRRENYARQLEGGGKFMTNRIAATRVREASINKAKQLQQAAAAFAATGGAPAGGAPAGGAPAGGAPAGGAPCWVAEVLYGVNNQKTHAARLWAATNNSWFIKLYKKYGRSWAQWLAVNKWAQPMVKPMWNMMAVRGELLAIRLRNSDFIKNEEFENLLEKVK